MKHDGADCILASRIKEELHDEGVSFHCSWLLMGPGWFRAVSEASERMGLAGPRTPASAELGLGAEPWSRPDLVRLDIRCKCQKLLPGCCCSKVLALNQRRIACGPISRKVVHASALYSEISRCSEYWMRGISRSTRHSRNQVQKRARIVSAKNGGGAGLSRLAQ